MAPIGDDVTLECPITSLPLALAELHRSRQTGDLITVNLPPDIVGDHRLDDVLIGAGFARWPTGGSSGHDRPNRSNGPGGRQTGRSGPRSTGIELARLNTLADTVGPDMTVLICGLNPSPYSAETGIGFGRPGNRFWPAALGAGMVSRDRDPIHALTGHGVGMTDLVKRTTRTAAELTADEYRTGLDRVEQLVGWLRPRLVCFVGLAGWRAAVQRSAVAGLQPCDFGQRPVYLMPSTSGLNASARLEDLEAHLTTAAQLAGR